jgi:hypothetical protein
MAVVAHGDYCDEKDSYLMKKLDFTTDPSRIIDFITNTGRTYGGDFPEAYEYVLNKAQDLSWESEQARCLVMIGDAYPHEKDANPHNLDWRDEVKELEKMGVNIYSVQCLNSGNRKSYTFYKHMAKHTNGYHLYLNQFSHVKDMMLGVCFRQMGESKLESYEQEVKDRLGGMTTSMRRMFDTMMGREVKDGGGGSGPEDEKDFDARYDTGAGDDEGDLRPCPPARFQMLNVDQQCSIKEFVNNMGLNFKAGRGFYQFTKPETIKNTKQVVLKRKRDGELFQGRKARRLAKIPSTTGRVRPSNITEYDVFVQSTSYNRKLLPATSFLYEVPSEE